MKKKLLAVFLFSATTMLCAQTLQTSNKYFEVGNFKEVHNPAWGVTDDLFRFYSATGNSLYERTGNRMSQTGYSGKNTP